MRDEMSLRDVRLKYEYRSISDDIANDFYIPSLFEAVAYKRAVGFFSSTALSEVVEGIEDLARRSGHIRLVASPVLSPEDIEAINLGYKKREAAIAESMERFLAPPESSLQAYRLNLLANLIADGLLDIKLAFTVNDSGIGLYHEKIGAFQDKDGNVVAFDGSLNESKTALSFNYETVNVYFSWNDLEGRCAAKTRALDAIWQGSQPGVETVDYPDASNRVVDRYYTSRVNYEYAAADVLARWYKLTDHGRVSGRPAISPPKLLKGAPFEFQDYQEDAINAWVDNGYRGIFDMATGTGKTFTGLGAAARAYEDNNRRLALFVICPYQHLVEQWLDDLRIFGVNEPIVAYGGSPHGNWRKLLRDAIYSYSNRRKGKGFFCCIATNATFAGEDFQRLVRRLKGTSMLMADEVHNMGASTYRRALTEAFDYRLGLTATLDRHFDGLGTGALIDYFGKRCIEYPIDRAIKEGKLCHYRYYPVICYLSDTELEEYERLSQEMKRCWINERGGGKHLSDQGKRYAMARARVVAAASSKIASLKRVIEQNGYETKNHILVYCGAARLLDDGSVPVGEDNRQIKVVIRELYKTFGMRVSAFTAEEDIRERTVLKDKFANGDLQALVAIKCLDEGVNIPNIQTAFMLASTTNPKEYIQRRGRLLRKSDGKLYATIYDFVTLPRRLDTVAGKTKAETASDISLVNNEIMRMQEFTRSADNYADGKRLIDEMMRAYHLDEIQDFDYEEG